MVVPVMFNNSFFSGPLTFIASGTSSLPFSTDGDSGAC